MPEGGSARNEKVVPDGTFEWFFRNGTLAAVSGRAGDHARLALSPQSSVWVGMGDVAANLCGFALGACSSYVLNKTFTFGSRKRHLQAAPAFVLLIGVCMAANLAVLLLALHALHLPSMVAQAAAVLTYNVLFFLGSKLVVFTD